MSGGCRSKDPDAISGVVVFSHVPFPWGTDPMNAVHNAFVTGECAFMDFHALLLNPQRRDMLRTLPGKHYLRKHGTNACCGRGRRKSKTKRCCLLRQSGF